MLPTFECCGDRAGDGEQLSEGARSLGQMPPSGDDLFSAARDDQLARRAPLAERLRPVRLDDIVGQDELLGPGRPLRSLIEADRLSSVILWGPAGTGKTTLARLIARSTEKVFESLSAVSASVKDVREIIAQAERRLGERNQGTILFLDEVHRFNKSQQDALLPSVESGLIVLIGATTENPHFEVNPPLMSRSTLFRLQPLDTDALGELADRGSKIEGVTLAPEARTHLVLLAAGDGRHLLTSLEVAAAIARHRLNEATANRSPEGAAGESATTGRPNDATGKPVDSTRETSTTAGRPTDTASGVGAIPAQPTVTLADAEAALGARSVRYGRDDHFDVISAFIKSIRGSDADAGIYWLATMLEAGEDARFIARRLVILASEDIGMADPMSLLVANAAAHAVEFVGLPEAQLNLSQAVIHLATAPKSNSATRAISAARRDVRDGVTGEVPVHLRDSHYKGAASLGHGEGYEYPHDDDRGWLPQQYLPDEVSGRRYYEPSGHGHEGEVADRMRQLRTNDPKSRP